MSEYIVTARKWRPMRFEDVVGQAHITRTLLNALSTGRLAHAYLFSGPRGVGKTTTARLLAKAVNCRNPVNGNPDSSCDICREITDGTSFDVLEIDGASNRGIDEIRNLRDSVRYAPAKGRFKIYIIDEVHMLTKESFNALLKTLEEPPTHVMFIFATTEIHKVPATILSRCQRFDFRRISLEEIMGNLRAIAREEKIEIDEPSLMVVARKGDGSLRDAQSIFDQVVSLCGRKIALEEILEALNMVDQEVYFRVTHLIRERDAKGVLTLVDELLGQGHDMKDFLAGLLEHIRNLLVVKATGSPQLLETAEAYKGRYAAEAEAFSVADLLRFQRLVGSTEQALRTTVQPRYRLEADLVQLVTLPGAADVSTLIDRIEELKKKGVESPRPVTGKTFASVRKPEEAATAPVRMDPAQRTETFSEGELRSRWEEILAEVRRQRMALSTVLEAGAILGVTGNIVRVAFVDEFHVSHIQRNKEFLSTLLSKVLGVTAKIEAVADRGAASAAPGTSRQADAEEPAPDHPMLAALKRELGAEPLE